MSFDLPNELKLHIFGFLRLKDLPNALRVATDWKRLIDADRFFIEKTGASKQIFKIRFLQLDPEVKNLYLNQEGKYLTDNHMDYWKIALDLKLITPEQAFKFSKEVLQLLLSPQGLLNLQRKVFDIEQFLKILERDCIQMDVFHEILSSLLQSSATEKKLFTRDEVLKILKDKEIISIFETFSKDSELNKQKSKLDKQQREMRMFVQRKIENNNSIHIDWLLNENQFKEIEQLAPELLISETFFQILVLLTAEQRNRIVNIKNFIKAVQHPNALWAFENHLITLEEIQATTFDERIDLSTEMLNIKQNSKNNNNNDLAYFTDDDVEKGEFEEDSSEEQNDEEEMILDVDSDDLSDTKSTTIR